MQPFSFSKRFRSFFYPVLIRKSASVENALLELYLYRGRMQLATVDALYSDGDHYRPLVSAYKEIRNALPDVKKVLVLGTGLGSAVMVMHKFGHHPDFTLVDNDKTVIQWALECMEDGTQGGLTPLCMDAALFIRSCKDSYDLVIVDIFKGRTVPPFVTSEPFLMQCRQRVAPGRHLILNYIISDIAEWKTVKALFDKVFPRNKILQLGINRVVIATV